MIWRKIRRLTMGLALVCLLGPPMLVQGQTIGFDIVGERNSITISFESYNNLIVLPVILNHRLPLRFVLDTGVRTSILTDRTFSDILNISYDRKIPLVGADGDKQIVAYVANGISLKLPGVVGQGQALLVLEEDYLQLKNYLGTEVHGILGYELFSRFIVEIDYDDRLLTLHEPYSYKPSKWRRSMPLILEDTKPYIHTLMTLENGTVIPTKFMLDTGASHSMLLDLESEVDLVLPEKVIRTNLGRGLGGNINGFVGRIGSVQFGKYQFDQVIASWPDEGSFTEILRKTGRHGTLGSGLLNRFTVVFDYFNGKFYYRKNRNFHNKFEYNMSGIEVKAMGQHLNEFVVQYVSEGSPALESDIQVGDIIQTINGQPTKNLSLSDVNNMFRQKDGKKLRLVIIREDEKLIRKFALRRML